MLKIERKFQIAKWDESSKQKTNDFWSHRRITFIEVSENNLVGKRGSIFGNLTSFDMSKLITKLEIAVSSEGEINCVMKVNTVLQYITEYNRAWWDLEMETFESFILRNEELKEKWIEFQKVYNNWLGFLAEALKA